MTRVLFTIIFIIFSYTANAQLEKFPVFLECESFKTNQELKQCMSNKISSFIVGNFNQSTAKGLGLSDGLLNISVVFKIDTDGNIIDIRSRGPHLRLEEEAIRVIKTLPKFTSPGTVDGKPVIVPFSLPIKFNLVNAKFDSEKNQPNILPKSDLNTEQFPVYRGCNENLTFKAQKKCTTEKIMNFLRMSFDLELADKLFPQEKSTKFQVEFIVNEKGKVEEINAKAFKKEIAAEAIKIMKRLPKLKKSGYINGKPVKTPFKLTVTIYF